MEFPSHLSKKLLLPGLYAVMNCICRTHRKVTVKLCKESETVPSVCYEYVLSPLVNKEASLAYGIAE